MCFGGCGSLGHCTGSIAYILEKLVSFIAMTAVILCIVMTVTISLGLGIGLGYNYCFVDLKVFKDPNVNDTTTETPTTTTTLAPDPVTVPDASPPTDQATLLPRRRMPPTSRPRSTLPMPAIKHTMAIPLNGDFDFPSLLSKLRRRNQNVTLELIT